MKVIEINKGRIISPFSETQINGKYELSPLSKKRTNRQNNWIHGFLFPPAALEMTKKLKVKVSAKMAKVILKSRCGVDYMEVIDEWIVTPTSEMSTVRMIKFIEDSLKYMATKYNVYLEGPNEEQWRQIKEEK